MLSLVAVAQPLLWMTIRSLFREGLLVAGRYWFVLVVVDDGDRADEDRQVCRLHADGAHGSLLGLGGLVGG